jgi:hypothetical protein
VILRRPAPVYLSLAVSFLSWHCNENLRFQPHKVSVDRDIRAPCQERCSEVNSRSQVNSIFQNKLGWLVNYSGRDVNWTMTVRVYTTGMALPLFSISGACARAGTLQSVLALGHVYCKRSPITAAISCVLSLHATAFDPHWSSNRGMGNTHLYSKRQPEDGPYSMRRAGAPVSKATIHEGLRAQ